MRRAFPAFAAALALLPAAASATSITAARPHDPKLGCKAIKQVVEGFNKGRLQDPDSMGLGPTFYSDALGEVEEKEEAAFLYALRHSEGKRDRKPMRIYGIFTVLADKEGPIYLVVLDRESWHEKRLVPGDMLDMLEIDDPHWDTDSSLWLVSFSSNHIYWFREAGEMYRLMSSANRLESCSLD
ncbi:MAG TPA: hypothetical protein VFR28_12215 [Allosphingosinicella sp.]|jgi:hypothetical protein|nr:hypothetical protein [Allosphingosinicella sp.]